MSVFFNSVIQSLYSIDSFREFIKTLHTNEPSTVAIQDLFSTIENSEIPIETYEFIKSIVLPGYDHIQREQFDAQECINSILNHVYQVHLNEIPAESAFRVSFLESVLCQSCNNPSERTEYYNMSRIQFPNHLDPGNSTKDMIEKLTNDPYGEFLQDYICSNCPTRTNATKSRTLFNVSDALIIQLVIFRYDQTTGSLKKLVPNLNIETEIENVLLGTLKLQAIIYHHGETPNSGHYSAVVKYDKQWYSVNDEHVTLINSEEFNCKASDKIVPYVLIFKKCNQEVVPMPMNSDNNLSDRISSEGRIFIESSESSNTFKNESELIGSEKHETKEKNVTGINSSTTDFSIDESSNTQPEEMMKNSLLKELENQKRKVTTSKNKLESESVGSTPVKRKRTLTIVSKKMR